ncbi:dihydrofolate reductase family protein [Modestobacter sp. VKM Ac-2986]|uniref:dihydrofolate reductase family protein n=1 Tax=Modestobacter sp. VKM Ac-2986 TaxID=3004140 RepID=UPI0022AA933E|nr:dihydrofolate reductase family protein [Modestobacter sp. VKM Ac-2986]MCZ2828582.1 dihydrofolate reductase family protein [Modestobacter sp. VKM Ac-2986]
MGRLQYAVLCSLDGYTADADGRFDWAAPDEELHAFVNDLERPVGTHLYGRRMYETLAVWQDVAGPDHDPVENDYAEIWRAADKVVYSTTLAEVGTPRTRLERTFDPAAVARLKAGTDRDLAIGGPGLAAHALRAGLVDDLHQFVHPVVVGGGTRALPDGLRLDLELVSERRFAGGVVHLHHRVEP